MPLSDEETKLLEELTRKQSEPEPLNGRGPNVDVYIDLSDEQAVERAIGFGLLTKAEVEKLEDDEGTPVPEDGDEETPKPKRKPAAGRRGYFDDK